MPTLRTLLFQEINKISGDDRCLVGAPSGAIDPAEFVAPEGAPTGKHGALIYKLWFCFLSGANGEKYSNHTHHYPGRFHHNGRHIGFIEQ